MTRPRTPTVPTELRIGPHRVRVDTSPDAAQDLRELDRLGDSRTDRLLIRLDTDRPGTAIADTLIHESLHTIWARSTALSHDHDDTTEERVITALAPHILALLRDNPDLVTYLTTTESDQ